jgi:hypothetical protein
MKVSRNRIQLWLLAIVVACGAMSSSGSPWLRLDEESVKVLRADLVRIETDVRSGKLAAEGGRQLANHIASRLRELEEQLPVRRRWAEVGKADARRDLVQGKVYCFKIDEIYFPGRVCSFGTIPEEDWNRAMSELTGTTTLAVRPRGEDLWLLASRVDGYNQEVWNYLTARHGLDIFTRVEARARHAGEQRGLWAQTWEGVEPFVPFIAALSALLLLARMVEIRKQRERLAPAIGAT